MSDTKSKSQKIPEQAKCVFQGTQFRIWQWDQVEFDGATKLYELCERYIPTLWVIAVVGDKILIQEEEHAHMPGHIFLSLPGGKGEDNEEPLAGAKRELSEESGYSSDEWVLWKEEHGNLFWKTYGYIARNAAKTHEQHLDGGERINPKLISIEEFFELDKVGNFRGDMLMDFLKEVRGDQNKKDEFIKLLFNI